MKNIHYRLMQEL